MKVNGNGEQITVNGEQLTVNGNEEKLTEMENSLRKRRTVNRNGWTEMENI